MPHGKLIVILESAIGIKDASKHGRGDSYCTLQCGSQILSTQVAEGCGSHPIFHTEFKFNIDRSTNDLVISVYSASSTGGYALVGTTTLVFKTVFFHGHVVPLTSYPLTRRSGKAGGHISVSLTFKARPSPYTNDPHAVARQRSAPAAAAAVHHPGRNQQYNYEDGYGSSGSGSSSSSRDRHHSPTYRRTQSQPEPQYYEFDEPAVDLGHAQAQYHHARPTPLRPTVVVHHARPNAPHRAIPVKREVPPPPPPGPHMAFQYPQRPVYQGQQQGPVYQGQQQGPVYQGQQQGPLYQGQQQGPFYQGQQQGPVYQGQRQGPVYHGQGRGRGRGRGRGGRCQPQPQQLPGMVAQVNQGVQALGDVVDMVGNVAELAGGIGDIVGNVANLAGGFGDLMGGLGGLFGGD